MIVAAKSPCPGTALNAFRRFEAGIRVGIWWNIALLLGSLLALPFDHRRILGLNPWIKPIKFEISVIVFLATMGLLLTLLQEAGRLAKMRALLGWGFGICMIVENTIIATQSARGVRSHMNFSTPADAIAFAVMGLFIAMNTALLAVLLALFCGRLPRPAPELWGIRLGLAMLLAASAEGVRIVMNNGHTVGAPEGGTGLPFLNWSMQHGDLRVAHFFALHALQVFWLLGWLLARSELPTQAAVGITFAAATLYAGGVWFLFASAMAGHPLLAGG